MASADLERARPVPLSPIVRVVLSPRKRETSDTRDGLSLVWCVCARAAERDSLKPVGGAGTLLARRKRQTTRALCRGPLIQMRTRPRPAKVLPVFFSQACRALSSPLGRRPTLFLQRRRRRIRGNIEDRRPRSRTRVRAARGRAALRALLVAASATLRRQSRLDRRRRRARRTKDRVSCSPDAKRRARGE